MAVPDAGLLVAAGVAVGLAAKAHGRQVRLEREQAGFERVDFMANNDPWVEALWARDRRLYWPAFAAGALLAGALLAMAWPLPWLRALPLLAVPLLAGFLVAGLASLARFARAPATAKDAAWKRAALRGSAAWWGLVALALAALLLVL